MKKFAELPEPERMIFIAQLCHNMWYDDSCFADVERLMERWKTKDIKEAVFFPNQTETLEKEVKD